MEYLNDKPESVSLKDWLIRRQAVRSGTPISVLTKVIDFQFNEANKALDCRVTKNNSVELSGFGKFVFSMNKYNRNLKRYEEHLERYLIKVKDPTITPLVKKNLDIKIEYTMEYVRILKERLNNV